MKNFYLVTMLMAGLGAHAAETIQIDTSDVIRTLERNPLGINFNYIRDDDANTPDPNAPRLRDVLKDLNVKWVRYPGGEKSDHHRFALPPYTNVNPIIKNTRDGYYTKWAEGYDLFDFDEFVQAAREMAAEPVVVVPYDSKDHSNTDLKEFIEHAAGWVRYANVIKKYNIRYWEIGNENWHPNSKNPIDKRSRDVLEIAKAMRAVDPSIKLGASGMDGDIVGDALDFITYSNYEGMKIDQYRTTAKPRFSKLKQGAPNHINMPLNDKEIFAVEFNAVEFTKPQDWAHDVNHCLQLFDMMGQILSDGRIDCAMIWNTRWMEEDHSGYLWYTVDRNNALTPIGHVYSMWSNNLKPNIVRAEGPEQTRCFAMHNPKSGELSVMVVNQSAEAKTVTIDTDAKFKAARHQVFSGKDAYDNWGTLKESTGKAGTNTQFILPALSANVITLK